MPLLPAPRAVGLFTLVLLAPLATVACAAPTASDDTTTDDVPQATDEGLAPASSQPVYRPDFVALAYGTHGGCRDGAGKFHYRFYLKNQGNQAGVVPMTKIDISVPWSDNDSLLDYTTYVFNTSLAVGETKLVNLLIPYSNVYPTNYEAVVQPDVAKVVPELSDANNDLVKNTIFWSGVPQPSNCT